VDRDGASSSRLAKHGYVVGIASESGDVIFHPLHRRNLIEIGIIAGGVMLGFLGQFRVGQKTEDVYAVVYTYGHDSSFGQFGQIIAQIRSSAVPVCTAVDPYDNWQTIGRCLGRSPDIEIQAVFAHHA
jgi:hypothetical protein